MLYSTIEQAQEALQNAEADVAAGNGEEAVEAAWGEIVRAVAEFCTPEVASELIRRNL